MKKTSFAILFIVIFTNVYSQYSGELYFVKSYSFGREVGRSTLFSSDNSSINLTMMVSTNGPINLNNLYVQVYRYGNNEKDVLVFNKEFDVQPDWDYIFFADIILSESKNKSSYEYIGVLRTVDGELILSSEPISVFFPYR